MIDPGKSARTYTILISLLVLLFAEAAILLTEWAGFGFGYLNYIIMGVLIWAATFLLVRFFFKRVAEQRIRSLFESVQRYTIAPDKPGETNEKGTKVSETIQTKEINKLRRLEKYRKDFLGNVSHELKTPIFNIQGYLLTLLDGGIEDARVNKLYLKRAEKSTNRLINIVEDLDSIARLESGEYILDRESFNLVKVVEDVIDDHEMSAKQQNIRISLNRKYNKAIRVIADKKRITEVLNNLVNNSIKYGKEGGKTTIGFMDTDTHVLVDISDNGIGIEEKDLPRIFERFFRVDKSRSRESGGTGLGLSIVKHIIQAHDQTITVRSKVNQGSTFIFSLDKAQ